MQISICWAVWLWHSAQNRSPHRRWCLLVAYNRADNDPVCVHHHPGWVGGTRDQMPIQLEFDKAQALSQNTCLPGHLANDELRVLHLQLQTPVCAGGELVRLDALSMVPLVNRLTVLEGEGGGMIVDSSEMAGPCYSLQIGTRHPMRARLGNN